MSKRRLTQKQHQRIKKNQLHKASQSVTQTLNEAISLDESAQGQGLVISRFGKQLELLPLSGITPKENTNPLRCYQRTHLPSIVTGDYVTWQKDAQDNYVVVARSERHSELCRPDNQGRTKTVAANIDQILIVTAPEPTPHRNLIDRYLVAAWKTGIKPTLLMNKADLLNNNTSSFETLISDYQKIGYPFHLISTKSNEGIINLQHILKDKVSIFVGQSGVGKSSLINAIIPEAKTKVGQLSTQMKKGTHTTTTSELFHLASGGKIIDSPGIREFSLSHIEPEIVANAFPEFQSFLGHCRFRNCQHQKETGCAIQEAVTQGCISLKRIQSYHQIIQSLTDTR